MSESDFNAMLGMEFVRAIARCTNTSKRTAFTEAEIRDQDDRLIAKATGTFVLTETFVQSEQERV